MRLILRQIIIEPRSFTIGKAFLKHLDPRIHQEELHIKRFLCYVGVLFAALRGDGGRFAELATLVHLLGHDLDALTPIVVVFMVLGLG